MWLCISASYSSDITEFINYISKCLTTLLIENKECYVTGDFNLDLLIYDTCSKHKEFLNTMTSFVFLPHILQPSRITESSATLIDNIYRNNINQESISGNILIQLADYLAQFISVEIKVNKIKPHDRYKRDLTNYQQQSFLEDINIQNWNNENLEGTDNKFNDFLWRLEGCIDRHAPLKKMSKNQLKKQLKPWIYKYILKLISRRDTLFSKHKKDPTYERAKHNYKLFRNRITREIKKTKRDHYQQYFRENLSNMKKKHGKVSRIL